MSTHQSLREALDVFARVAAIMEPLGLPDDTPLRDCSPGVWPTLGDCRKARAALAASQPEPVDGPCELCGEQTESLAARPSRWPVRLPKPGGQGKLFPHHYGCVTDRLYTAQPEPVVWGIWCESENVYHYANQSREFIADWTERYNSASFSCGPHRTDALARTSAPSSPASEPAPGVRGALEKIHSEVVAAIGKNRDLGVPDVLAMIEDHLDSLASASDEEHAPEPGGDTLECGHDKRYLYGGPSGCPKCGAPQCCWACCRDTPGPAPGVREALRLLKSVKLQTPADGCVICRHKDREHNASFCDTCAVEGTFPVCGSFVPVADVDRALAAALSSASEPAPGVREALEERPPACADYPFGCQPVVLECKCPDGCRKILSDQIPEGRYCALDRHDAERVRAALSSASESEAVPSVSPPEAVVCRRATVAAVDPTQDRERAEHVCGCADCEGMPPTDYERCDAERIAQALADERDERDAVWALALLGQTPAIIEAVLKSVREITADPERMAWVRAKRTAARGEASGG